MLPWLSVPLAEDEEDFATRFRTLANAHRWTVVLFGDHDGMGGLDARAAAISGHSLFRRDLTVPPGNVDASGPLRAADTLAWPQRAILNRGATAAPDGRRARILLVDDVWWADRDLEEWLWIGDFRRRTGDRGGRLSLAHAVVDPAGATWVAIGDTSPVLTRQIIGDPRPVLRLLNLATLLPAALLDAGLLLIALATAANGGDATLCRKAGAVAAVALAVSLMVAGTTSLVRVPASTAWQAMDVGESGFEASNFNAALAAEPALLVRGWSIERRARSASRHVPLPAGPTVSFMHVEDSAWLGGVTLSGCWRLGSLDTEEEGPRLMDAQSCRVDGEAEVRIGDRMWVAILRIEAPFGPWIVVLDRGFLAEASPKENAAWLLRAMRAARGGCAQSTYFGAPARRCTLAPAVGGQADMV